MPSNGGRPITQQRDLAKLPRALVPLIERPQWAVWRWTQRSNGAWQKPPFMAMQPQRHASTKEPNTWSDYASALAAVQAGHADGISYILTEQDPFAAIDIDNCRHLVTYSIDVWAQNFLDVGRHSYSEVTPSGAGWRIWGFADGEPLNRKFTLEIDGKPIAAELFRRTNKALTVTGYTLDPAIRQLANIDKALKWAVVWGERRKAAVEQATSNAGNDFNGGGNSHGFSVDQIEQIVREGAPSDANRSDLFHAIVGHYLGCGWDAEKIFEHLQQFPNGIGARYIGEERLSQEINRSAGKYGTAELPLINGSGWTGTHEAKTPQPEPKSEPEEQPQVDPELEDDPEIEDDELDDELGDDEPVRQRSGLPQFYGPHVVDDRPLKAWLIKNFIPQIGHGLMSGQFSTGKTFIFFELAGSLMTAQPFLGHPVKRQCGVLLLAAEGADEVRLRRDAMLREKCGNMAQAPLYWYEGAPFLLHKGTVKTLVAMARQVEAALEKEFGLPLGLIAIDTIAARAGYSRAGDEYDNAVGQAIMNVLRAVAQEMKCFVLGIDHFGKSLEAGTRGASAKESSADVVLACLGDKQLSGLVTNTRLAIRKHRGGTQGQEYSYALRLVEAPEKDEDGDAITTRVVDWLPPGSAQTAPAPDDPWAKPKRQDQRTAALRLKRVLMMILAEKGIDLPIPPDGPVVRMVDQKLVRKAFYACTVADGDTPKQKTDFRRKRFSRALDWAEDEQLIGVSEIDDVAYLWLRPRSQDGENED